jgi:predicted DNA-binding transcriptional regulator AlpA
LIDGSAPSQEPNASLRDDPAVRLLSKRQLLDRVPLSFPSIWQMMRRGEFPAARTIGSRPFWLESEINEWVSSRPVRTYKPP